MLCARGVAPCRLFRGRPRATNPRAPWAGRAALCHRRIGASSRRQSKAQLVTPSNALINKMAALFVSHLVPTRAPLSNRLPMSGTIRARTSEG